MASAAFLELPLEIRRKIYHYFFADSPISLLIFEVDKKVFSWFRKDPLYRWVQTSRPPDQLLDVCRQVRDEALPELQSGLRVTCDITKRAASANMTVIPTRLALQNSIRFLHLIVYSEYTFWPQNEMPHLRHVLIESKYNVWIVLRQSRRKSLNKSATPVVDAVRSWHLDLLNEPEIPAGPGSWGMLKAILDPTRQFRLEWKGRATVNCEGGFLGPASPFTCLGERELHFDWDTKQVLAGDGTLGIAQDNALEWLADSPEENMFEDDDDFD